LDGDKVSTILVIGGGSLGLLFAGKVRAKTRDQAVHLITRSPEQAQEIRDVGLIIDGHPPIQSMSVHSISEDLAGRIEPPSWIFLMVKQKHLESSTIFDYIQYIKGPKTSVVCFQNGIGHIEKCKEHLTDIPIYAAVTTEGAKKISAHKVLHTGTGKTAIGQINDGETVSSPNENKLIELLNMAGFNTFMSKEMNRLIWNKLLINAVINPLTALMRVTNGELPRLTHGKALMYALMTEGINTAKASGISVSEQLWDDILEVCERTSSNTSSMLADILAGRETEIEWINGQIIKAAKRYGLQTPTHIMIYQLVKGLEIPRTLS
jgi:2-dehydropantoate 2-reductase